MSYVIVAVSRRFFFVNDLCARYGYLLFRHSSVYNVFNLFGTNLSNDLHCVDKNHKTVSKLFTIVYELLSLHYCQLTKNEYSDVVSLMVNRLMFRTWCSIYIPTSTKYFIFLFSFILLEINIFCFVCKMEKCVRT